MAGRERLNTAESADTADTADTEASPSSLRLPNGAPPVDLEAVEPLSDRLRGYAVAPVTWLVRLPRWFQAVALALVVVSIVGNLTGFGGVGEVPEGWVVGRSVSRAVDGAVDWMVVTWDPFFSAINTGMLRYLLLPLERWLLFLPWWVIALVTLAAAYKLASRTFAVVAMAMLVVVVVLGLHDAAMSTLAIALTACLLAIVFGIPVGILMARSDRADAVIRPVLDTMQTMPSFVYLIPVLMLFGLGMVPAVIATIIYAIPPLIRLTSLGIREVDSSVLEASRAFGATGSQILVKVQFPLALPSIMAGLNQTIMMALAMVVIASMIGARGLGIEVLNGIARLEVGRGLLGGIGIVIMAVILDRITQGFGKSQQAGRPGN